MFDLAAFYAAHPFWTWTAVGAALLAIEVAVGSGYLLWAAAAAGVVAVVSVFLRPGLPVELGVFAVLTIVSALVAHRFFPAKPDDTPDINDLGLRLVGREGNVVGGFDAGHGRVFVEGKEWAAEIADGATPVHGERVAVVGVQDGASLLIRRLAPPL